MFKRILVPLDESERAEHAIPVAVRLAHAAGGTIILLEVVPPPIEFGPYYGEPPSFVQRAIDTDTTRATNYLTYIAQSNVLTSVSTTIQSVSGWPAPTILTVGNELHIDLIVMSSHGRSGLSRWVLGSVAGAVIRQALIPVLVLHQHVLREIQSDDDQPLRGLVALDGSPAAEAVLAPAASLMAMLALPGQAVLHLIHVIRVPTALDTSVQQVQHAETYLRAVTSRIQQEMGKELHCSVIWSLSSAQDVADTLLRKAEGKVPSDKDGPSDTYDLLMMATHGWGGFSSRGLGSIMERVLHASKLSLLIVPSPTSIP